MGVLWRYSVIAVGALAMLGGAFLTMGHLRSREADYTQAELAKLKAMSSNWEMRLSSVRSAFQDQIWRQDLVPMTERPEDWTSWRVEEKLRNVQELWINENGKLRGFGFFSNNELLHTAWGDTSGLEDARDHFKASGNPDLLVSETKNGLSGCVATRYRPAVTDSAQRPGELILLVDRESVLSIPDSPPQSWMLMDGPQSSLYASTASASVPFQKATWNILLSEESGIVPQSDGSPYGFSRLRVPGMYPMLLLTEIKTPSSLANAAGAIILLGGGVILLAAFVFASVRRRAKPTLSTEEEKESPPENGETVSFRQIFQAVKQPLCVIDTHSRLIRVNSAARSLLNVQKGGKPDPKIIVSSNDTSISVEKLLESLHDYSDSERKIPIQRNHFRNSTLCRQ
jgi:PAS domain-containing protein